jgi:2-phospho-L-lactate guanylyltransferase
MRIAHLALQGSPHVSKSRLGDILTAEQRLGLMRFGIARLASLAPAGTLWLLAEDEEAGAMGRTLGVPTIVQPHPDLNRSLGPVIQGFDQFDAVTVLPSDLVFLESLAPWGPEVAGDLLLTPDQRLEGTNVLRIATRLASFPFSYGPDSFARHLAAGREAGLSVRLVGEAQALDLDWPNDLELARELFAHAPVFGAVL